MNWAITHNADQTPSVFGPICLTRSFLSLSSLARTFSPLPLSPLPHSVRPRVTAYYSAKQRFAAKYESPRHRVPVSPRRLPLSPLPLSPTSLPLARDLAF